jgi:thiamine kinase-like enzyme
MHSVSTVDYSNIIDELGFGKLHSVVVLQSLWGGYGELVRLFVDDTSIVVKQIQLPKPELHPRGWNTDLSHQRKLKSYQVELAWYQYYAASSVAVTPKPLHVLKTDNQWQLVMEDLHTLGFTNVEKVANKQQLSACLEWLATFHAQHIEERGLHLWESGTYWHLATRPDELEALTDHELKSAATKIDSVLSSVPYQTLVHGDAKLANFCFTAKGDSAAAVDFQYVGRGCAMKDVALFMSSAVIPAECYETEEWLLAEYFSHLKTALKQHQPELNPDDVERAWRPMFPIAWADFQRFVKGWSPGHWKINNYTEALTAKALKRLTEDFT